MESPFLLIISSISLPFLILDISYDPTREMGMVPIPNPEFLYDYTLNFPNRTLYGVFFDIRQTPNLDFRYQVWYK